MRPLLFRQGSSHSGIYIIRKGRIRTFYVSPSGREITLAYWSSNHFVGGPEVFGRGTHVWSGMAMCNAEVLYLTGAQLRELILELPNFALALIEGQITKGQCFSSLIQLLGTKRIGSFGVHSSQLPGERRTSSRWRHKWRGELHPRPARQHHWRYAPV